LTGVVALAWLMVDLSGCAFLRLNGCTKLKACGELAVYACADDLICADGDGNTLRSEQTWRQRNYCRICSAE
jgi:hypothetical protein